MPHDQHLLHVAHVPIVLETLHIADIPVRLEILHGLRRKVSWRRAVYDVELVAGAKDDRACRHFPGTDFVSVANGSLFALFPLTTSKLVLSTKMP